MNAMTGFSELFGRDVEILDYISGMLSNVSRHHGYKRIQLPVLEKASSYSENVVGRSPWPEWNSKGCFFFPIQNYETSYDDTPKMEEVLLIPEGTVSITRWLGEQIATGGIIFPLRMFYNLHCYRNEVLSTLSKTKRREFSQFGLEILGSSHPHSDLEILCIAIECLRHLGVAKEQIRIRLNDITIFGLLVKRCGLEARMIELKELLDTLAEVKAGKGTERREKTLCSIFTILESSSSLSEHDRALWSAIIEQKQYDLSGFRALLNPDKDAELCYRLENLAAIHEAFAAYQIAVEPDLCVIRSHEYYTSISYEIDVLTDEHAYIEIAGGGRYDRLVTSFVPKDSLLQQVSCTGFAFGVERLIDMLKQENWIPARAQIVSTFSFETSHMIELVPAGGSPIDFLRTFTNSLSMNEPSAIRISSENN